MTRSTPHWRRRLGTALAVFAAAYLLVGYFVIPAIVKKQIMKIVTNRTGLVPTLQKVRFDPLKIRLSVEGFELKEERVPTPVLQFEQLVVDLRPIGFLTSDIALDELRIVRPRLSVTFNEQAELNLLRIFSRSEPSDSANPGKSSDSPPDGESEPLIVDITLLGIEGGSVEFRDRTIEEPFELNLALLDLEMQEVSTRLGKMSSYALNLSIGPSSRLKWVGNAQLSPLRLDGQIDLDDFDLSWPSTYLSRRLRFEVVRGALSLSTRYAASFEDGFDLELNDGRFDLSDLSIVDSGRVDGGQAEEVLAFPSLTGRGLEASVRESNLDFLSVSRISLAGGRVLARLGEDGQLGLIETFTPVGDAEPGIASESSRASLRASSRAEEEAEEKVSPRIRVGEFAVSDFVVDFEDRSLASPASIRWMPLKLTARGYDSASGGTFDFELETGTQKGGSLKLAGPISLTPLSATLNVAVSEWPVSVLGSYARAAGRIDLRKGLVSSSLELRVAQPGVGDPSAWRAKGFFQLDDLLVRDAQDESNLIEWERLRFDGLDLEADKFAVDEIGLFGAVTRVEVAKDGKINLQSIFEKGSGEREPESKKREKQNEKEGARSKIRVDRFRLAGARIAFVDESISPTFTMNLSSLNGTLEDLSSTQTRPAKVALEGVLDEAAPLRLSGQVSPFRSDLPSRIAISLTDMSMPTFSPYSSRYVGYGIDRGRLDMNLDYQWIDGFLKASNHFKLDRFVFGDRNASAGNASLPVPLALGLMSDSRGVIELDLPLSGNIDDPSFNLLGLLGKAFTQLITKVATAPFSMIGSIAGFSADELSHVDFEMGVDQLSHEERLKIDRLTEAIAGKPELSIEIRGRADPTLDGFQIGTERGDEKGRALARSRAASIRRAILANSAIASDRVFLVEVGIGNFGSERGVPSELSLVGG